VSESHVRALSLLEYLAAHPEPRSATEIAAEIGVARATVYRMLDELVRNGWLKSSATGEGYRPALRLAALGLGSLAQDPTRPAMFRNAVQLASQSAVRVQLAFWEDGEVLFTDAVEAFGESISTSFIGVRLPAACCAPGKAFLATLSESELSPILARGCPRFTSRTPSTAEQIRRGVEDAREKGFGFALGEYNEDYAGVAVVVVDRSGNPAGALTVGRTRQQGFDGYPQNVLDGLRYFADKTSRELGYMGGVGAQLLA
jgi:DNA-binding IclR family transcriptional regulator